MCPPSTADSLVSHLPSMCASASPWVACLPASLGVLGVLVPSPDTHPSVLSLLSMYPPPSMLLYVPSIIPAVWAFPSPVVCRGLPLLAQQPRLCCGALSCVPAASSPTLPSCPPLLLGPGPAAGRLGSHPAALGPGLSVVGGGIVCRLASCWASGCAGLCAVYCSWLAAPPSCWLPSLLMAVCHVCVCVLCML